jgi:hypothetical protein
MKPTRIVELVIQDDNQELASKNLSNEFIKVKDLYMSWFGRYNKTEAQAKELGIKLPSDRLVHCPAIEQDLIFISSKELRTT